MAPYLSELGPTGSIFLQFILVRQSAGNGVVSKVVPHSNNVTLLRSRPLDPKPS